MKTEEQVMSPTTLERIRETWKRWDVSCNVLIWDAMTEIGEILAEDEVREQRLKTISDDARRDRRATGVL